MQMVYLIWTRKLAQLCIISIYLTIMKVKVFKWVVHIFAVFLYCKCLYCGSGVTVYARICRSIVAVCGLTTLVRIFLQPSLYSSLSLWIYLQLIFIFFVIYLLFYVNIQILFTKFSLFFFLFTCNNFFFIFFNKFFSFYLFNNNQLIFILYYFYNKGFSFLFAGI